ncbi:hypothetical protein ZWY2020_018583 [Hordeum vulgare]|nr:hypothetical protein ZWY2020_018583 [Hordeum vulgare]
MVSWSDGESTEDSDLHFIASYDSPIKDNLPQVNHQNDGESNMEKDVEINKLNVVVDQLKFIHVSHGNIIRNMKHNLLKEHKKMSTDNTTLKWCWADLKKEKEEMDIWIAEVMKEKKWSIEKSVALLT